MNKNLRTTIARTLILSGLVWLNVVGLINCGGVPEKKYYSLEAVHQDISATDYACIRPLAIANVTSVPPYDERRIIYRPSRFEVGFYNYRLWAAEPADMVKRMLLESLTKAGISPKVSDYFLAGEDRLVLYTTIDAIEQVESKADDDTIWKAHLAMRFNLQDAQKKSNVWSSSFDREKVLKKRNVEDLSSAISDIYREEVNKLITNLKQTLPLYEGCKITPAPQGNEESPQ